MDFFHHLFFILINLMLFINIQLICFYFLVHQNHILQYFIAIFLIIIIIKHLILINNILEHKFFFLIKYNHISHYYVMQIIFYFLFNIFFSVFLIISNIIKLCYYLHFHNILMIIKNFQSKKILHSLFMSLD